MPARDDDAEYVIVDPAEYVRESDGAICFDLGGEERWIPKSLIGEVDQDAMTVEVKDWFAHKEGLI